MLTGTTSDSSAHVAVVLDGLNAVARACKVTSAALNDLKPPQIADRQMMFDSLMPGLSPFGCTLSVSGASVLQVNSHVASIVVNDSPAAVATPLSGLNSDSKIAQVPAAGGALLANSFSPYGAY